MAKTWHLVRERGEGAILLVLLCLWSFVWDYSYFGQYQREGRIKLLLAAAALLAGIRIGRRWHWSVGTLYSYTVINYLHFTARPWALPVADKTYVFTIDAWTQIACLTATALLVPEISRLISRRAFENAIIWAGLAHAAIGAANMAGHYVLPLGAKPEVDLPLGLLGQPTVLGPFLAYAGALAYSRVYGGGGWRDALVSCVLFGMAAATKSSMSLGVVAAAVVIIHLFYFGWPAAIATVPGYAGVILVMNHYDSNVLWHSGRLDIWRDGLSFVELRPWFGFGLGSWQQLGEVVRGARGGAYTWTYLHSEALQILVELGAVGAALAGVVVAAVMARCHFVYIFRAREMLTWVLGFVVFGLDSLANFALHLVPHGPIFALCVYQLLTFLDREDDARNSGCSDYIALP